MFIPAGIASNFKDQSTTCDVPHSVLVEERCCATLRASDSISNTLRGTTNSSTQHEPNTPLPGSFALEWNPETIGLITTAVVYLLFFVVVWWNRKAG
jgi:hypothetical protein